MKELTLPRAPRGRRLLAFLLDQLLVGLPGWVILALSPFRAVLPFMQEHRAMGWGFLSLALAFQLALAAQGRTLGRVILGLELRRRDGDPCSAVRGMTRDLLALLLWIPFLADPTLKTRVVSAQPFLGRWVRGGGCALSLTGILATLLTVPSPPSRRTLDWIQRNALPLENRTGSGLDLSCLVPRFAQSRVVGLGEATHGTRETSLIKGRLIETLVQEMGVTLLCIEAPYPNSLAANHYVLEGKGDPEKVVKALGFWTVGTEEVLELLMWMRSYNQEPGHRTKVQFLGMDIQAPRAAWMRIKDFLERRGKEHQDWGAQHSRRIEALGDQIGSYVDPARLKEALKDAEELLGYLDARKREFGETDPQGFREARQCALVLSQDLQSWLAGEERRIGLRDRFMADNILSFLDQEGPQAKAVVWAHNIHVSFAQAGLGGEDPMGFHLRKRLGSGYTSWGFVINQGTCTGWQGGELKAVRLGKAKPGSLEHGLARCGREAFALDLRSSLGHGLPPWFQRPLCMRCIGSVIPWFQGAHYVAGAPSQHFDGLVYLDRTNASKPL